MEYPPKASPRPEPFCCPDRACLATLRNSFHSCFVLGDSVDQKRHGQSHHPRLPIRWLGSSLPPQRRLPRPARCRPAHSRNRQVRFQLAHRHRLRLFPLCSALRHSSRTRSCQTPPTLRSHSLPPPLCHRGHDLHARPRLRHPLFRHGRRPRPRLHAHRLVLPLLRRLHRLARRCSHRQRHLLQRPLRRPPKNHRPAAQPQPHPHVRHQQRRRRHGQNDRRPIHLHRHCRHQPSRPGRLHLPLRLLALRLPRRHRRRNRHALRLRLPPIHPPRPNLHPLERVRTWAVKLARPPIPQ